MDTSKLEEDPSRVSQMIKEELERLQGAITVGMEDADRNKEEDIFKQ